MVTSTTRPHAHRTSPATGSRRDLAPGLAVSAAAVVVAWCVHRLAGPVPMLTAALLLGIVAVNVGVLPDATRPGTRFAAKTLMRAGVVLLGLQVSLSDIAGLGWRTIAMTVAVLLATLLGTPWLGRLMGLPHRLSLLVAAGCAICGASAVAAVDGVLGARDRDGREAADHDRRAGSRGGDAAGDGEGAAATAVAVVMLCGTLAIAVMPVLGRLLGLSAYDEGRWAGASVHDVGQVVATATALGPAAVVPAIAVKLIRVAMLAPVTTVIGLRARRGAASGVRRPPVLPVFLIAFVAMVAIRSIGKLPADLLNDVSVVKDLLFAAALFGLGTAVRVRLLVRTGHRALLLGLTSWVLIAGVSYAGVLLTR
jgi:uncharacterized membrane protein YadS